MSDGAGDARGAFIRANTRLMAPPLLPEIRLHLADEAVALWQMTARELAADDVAPPFWAFAWAGGQALARHLLDNPHLVAGKSVLVVAAGSGVEAIAAVQAGATRVTASDIDPYALAAMRLNAEANGVAFAITGEDYLAADAASAPVTDIVLLGDLCYEDRLARRLLAFAGDAARRSLVLLGDPGRNYLPRAGLEALAQYDVPTSKAIEDADVKRATVWRILPSET
jgi:predicted nicotinamide N-methyase